MADPIRHILVKNNVILSAVILDGIYDGVALESHEDGVLAYPSEKGGPGWLYVGGEVLPPEEPERPADPVEVVQMWALRTSLQNNNLFDQAQSEIENSNDNALKNLWEYGNYANKSSAAIASLAQSLNLTSVQLDKIFIDANKISN